MNKPIRTPIADGVYFNNVSDNRFKTGRISVSFVLPMNEEDAAANAILIFLLRRSCARYPTFQQVSWRLEELYGASVTASVNKLGDQQVLTLTAVSIDDDYSLNGEKISQELTDLLCQMIFDPNMKEGIFPEEVIHAEKRQLIERIEAEINEKRSYALHKCMELMCSGEPAGLPELGTKEAVTALTAEDIGRAWLRILENTCVEIFMVGSSDPTFAINKFKEYFSKIQRTPPTLNHIIKEASPLREKNEEMEIAQAKLVIGMRTVCENEYALRITTLLYGGTPYSKLFVNVRERLSLCYYCAARYNSSKGIVMVDSGVEMPNIEKARIEILRQLEELKQGNFTEEELNVTKLAAINSYQRVKDSLRSLEQWYLDQVITAGDDFETPEQAIEKIHKVTLEDVRTVAESMVPDTVYILKGKEGDESVH